MHPPILPHLIHNSSSMLSPGEPFTFLPLSPSLQVTCEGDCVCPNSTLDGHQTERNSLVHLFNFYTTQGKDCVVVVTVLAETLSGQHKVKLSGIMVSEESGQQDGIRNNLAVEYVADISHRSKDGTYDVKNHI